MTIPGVRSERVASGHDGGADVSARSEATTPEVAAAAVRRGGVPARARIVPRPAGTGLQDWTIERVTVTDAKGPVTLAAAQGESVRIHAGHAHVLDGGPDTVGLLADEEKDRLAAALRRQIDHGGEGLEVADLRRALSELSWPWPADAITSPRAGAPRGAGGDEGLVDGLVRRFYGGWEPTPGVLDPVSHSAPLSPAERAITDRIDPQRLREHVEYLASPELGGRDNLEKGSERARAYVVEGFRKAGLQPLFGESYRQEVILSDGTHNGTNVGAVLPATEPNPTGEYVAVFAHLDHMGVHNGELFAGADDNASGVASMLETARALAEANPKRSYDLVFLAPDSEEPPDTRTERMGSSYYVDHPPRPIEAMRLAVALDVIGNGGMNSVEGGEEVQRFMVLGAETSPQVADLVNGIPDAPGTEAVPLSVAQIEKDTLPWGRREQSDYFAVRNVAGLPFMMVTAGTTGKYHTPEDTPDSLDYGKIKTVSDYVARFLVRAANDTRDYDFNPRAVDPIADVEALQKAIPILLENPPEGLRPQLREQLFRDLLRLSEIVAEGKLDSISPAGYRELQGIAQDLQHAMTRPDQSKVEIVWHHVKRWFELHLE